MTKQEVIIRTNRISIYLMRFTFAMYLSMIAQSILELQLFYNVADEKSGLFISFQSIGGIIFLVFGSFLFDRFSKKNVLLVAVYILSVIVVVMSAMPSITIMYVLLILTGCSNGTIDILTNVMIGTQKNSNTTHMNILHLFFALGAISGPYIAVNIQKNYGISGMLRLFSVFTFIVGTIYLITKRYQTDQTEKEIDKSNPKTNHLIGEKRVFIKVIKIGLLAFLVGGSTIIPLTWLSGYTTVNFGLSRSIGALAISLYWLGRVGGLFLLPKLIKQDILKRTAFKLVILAAIVFVVGLVINKPILFIISVFIAGFLFSNSEPQVVQIALKEFSKAPAFAASIFSIAASISAIVVPIVVGYLNAIYGIKTGLYVTGLFMLILGSIALLLMKYNRSSEIYN